VNILITGGAKRVGKMLSEHLAAQGHKIAIHYNNSSPEANDVLKSIGGKKAGHFSIQANLCKLNEAETIFSELKTHWQIPDVLINNASTYNRRGMTHYSTSELLEDYNINFFAPLILMRCFRQVADQGSIINMLDKRVLIIDPEAGPYALAKKSLRDATLACASEWAPYFRVNGIAPGTILPPEGVVASDRHQELLNQLLEVVDLYISGHDNGTIRVIE
jgi:pteridine reductase